MDTPATDTPGTKAANELADALKISDDLRARFVNETGEDITNVLAVAANAAKLVSTTSGVITHKLALEATLDARKEPNPKGINAREHDTLLLLDALRDAEVITPEQREHMHPREIADILNPDISSRMLTIFTKDLLDTPSPADRAERLGNRPSGGQQSR